LATIEEGALRSSLSAPSPAAGQQQVQAHGEGCVPRSAASRNGLVEGIGWHFVRLSGLYRALPLESVKEWLERVISEEDRCTCGAVTFTVVR
jgi:hypothetical protein